MFSDVHNQIHFSLYNSVNKNNTYAGWNWNKADDFTQVLHNDNSNVVLNKLNTNFQVFLMMHIFFEHCDIHPT
jgi:hypothetical protein